jgi:Domain of unknown function (DUF1918)
MEAQVGDKVEVPGTRIDHAVRQGEILEVRGKGGAPPYLVKWLDTGQTALVFPGPDARIVDAS